VNSTQTINLLRVLFVVFTGYVGAVIGGETGFMTGGIALGTVFGLLVVLADRLLKGVSLRIFSSATFGLLMGLIAARLLLSSGILYRTSQDVQWMISMGVYSVAAYLGMMLAVRSNRDDFALIIPYVRFRATEEGGGPLLVDSNILIDGRLKEVMATGFLNGQLVVPRFVLEELQHLADSSDPLKRERGRSALERLQELQRTPGANVVVQETKLEAFGAVDSMLVQLAKVLGARLLTNDSNLCAIARLQGVVALNFFELNRALRPALNPGDEIELMLTKEGREVHQAVGYLQDGTMIVVNHARAFVGKMAHITIASVVQTSAGRLFFAELRMDAERVL
jgi:uncharacterized protein YacL